MKKKKSNFKISEVSKKKLSEIKGGATAGPFVHSLSNLEDNRLK